MRNVSKQKFKENIDLVLEQATSTLNSFMIETEKGNVILISEGEYKSYMKLLTNCMDSVNIVLSQRHSLF